MRVFLLFITIAISMGFSSAFGAEEVCNRNSILTEFNSLPKKDLEGQNCGVLSKHVNCCVNPKGKGCLEIFRKPIKRKICLRNRPYTVQAHINKYQSGKMNKNEKTELYTYLRQQMGIGSSKSTGSVNESCKQAKNSGTLGKEFNEDVYALCGAVMDQCLHRCKDKQVCEKINLNALKSTGNEFESFAASGRLCEDYTASTDPDSSDNNGTPEDGTTPDSSTTDKGSSISGGDLAKMGAAALPLLPMLMELFNKDDEGDQTAAIDPGPCANPNLSDDEKRTLIETNQCPGVIIPTTTADTAVEKLGGESADLSSSSADFSGGAGDPSLNGLNVPQQEFTGASVDSQANRRIGNGGGGGGGGPPGGGGGGGGGFGNDQNNGGGYDSGFDSNVAHGLKGGGGWSNTGPSIKTGADGGYSTPPNTGKGESFNVANYASHLPGGENDPNKRSIASSQIDRVRVYRGIWENGKDGYGYSCLRQLTNCNTHEMKMHQLRLGVKPSAKRRRKSF